MIYSSDKPWTQFGGWSTIKNSRPYPVVRRIRFAELNGVQSSLGFSPSFGIPAPGGWITLTYNVLPPSCFALASDDAKYPADAEGWNRRVSTSQYSDLGNSLLNSVVFLRSNGPAMQFGMHVSIDVGTTQLVSVELSMLDNLSKINYPRGIESVQWDGPFTGILRMSLVLLGFGMQFLAFKLTTAPGGGSPPTPPASAIIVIPAFLTA